MQILGFNFFKPAVQTADTADNNANKTMNITFICDIFASHLDREMFEEALPANIKAVFLSSPDDLDATDTKCLFVFAHSWMVGRLDPLRTVNDVTSANEKLGRKIDAVLLVTTPSVAYEAAISSFRNMFPQDIKFGVLNIGSRKIGCPEIPVQNRKPFIDLLTKWYNDRIDHPQQTPAPALLDKQEQRIKALEDQVARLTEELAELKKLIKK